MGSSLLLAGVLIVSMVFQPVEPSNIPSPSSAGAKELPLKKLAPQVHRSKPNRPTPSLSQELIQRFLEQMRLINRETIKKAPYIVQDSGLSAIPGEQLFVRNLGHSDIRHYDIIRWRGPHQKFATGAVLLEGVPIPDYEALAPVIGKAKLQKPGDPAKFRLISSREEVRAGDRLLPSKEPLQKERLQFKIPDRSLSGRIIGTINGHSHISQYQPVALNLGQNQGLKAGHLLAAHRSGTLIWDKIGQQTLTLPDEEVATLIVLRSFKQASLALVMETQLSLQVNDLVKTPKEPYPELR